MAELVKRDGSSTKSASTKAKADPETKDTKEKAGDGGKKTESKSSGSATGLRIGAVLVWLLAIGFEIVAMLLLFGKINITKGAPLIPGIIALVLDLICVIIGSALWKKSNRIDPASSKNKVKFWLWNNMGLIVCCFAFIPFVVVLLSKKEKLDSKTRTIAIVAAVVALLIGGLASYDFNPVSAEGKESAEQQITGEVYWTQFGTVYHIDSDCSHIANKEYYRGTVTEAIEEYNRKRLCKDCAKKHPEYTFNDEDNVIEK